MRATKVPSLHFPCCFLLLPFAPFVENNFPFSRAWYSIFYYLRRKFYTKMKRREYNNVVCAGYKKCSVANSAPSCFVIDIFFI